MTDTMAATGGIANAAKAGRFPQKGSVLHLTGRIMQVVQRLWAGKVTTAFPNQIGVSPRAVKYWIAQETAMSLEQVVKLLKTDEGFEILDAIMEDSNVRWMQVARLAHDQDVMAKQIRATERRLDAVKRRRAEIETTE